MQHSLCGFGGHPERHVAIKPMSPPFLPSSEHADRPRVKGSPNRAENFMDVSKTSGFRPPWCIPRNTMMLINYQVEWGLLPAPLSRRDNGCSRATTAENLNSANLRLWFGTRERICEPESIMSPLHERCEICERNAFGSAGLGVFRVPPVQHQKAHATRSLERSGFQKRLGISHNKLARHDTATFFSSSEVDLPGTQETTTTLPPSRSTSRRSS